MTLGINALPSGHFPVIDLEQEIKFMQRPQGSASPPTLNTGRSAGDYRSAKEITNTPLFKSLTQTLNTAPQLLQLFKYQIGGDWNDRCLSERTQADIAANAERVLKHLDQAGLNRSEQNNTIDGMKTAMVAIANPQKQHYAVQGSEAWSLIDFSQRGYIALTAPDIHNQHYHRPFNMPCAKDKPSLSPKPLPYPFPRPFPGIHPRANAQ